MSQQRCITWGRQSILLLGTMFLLSCSAVFQPAYTTFVMYKPMTSSELPGFAWKEQTCIDFILYSYIPQDLQVPPYPQGFGLYIGGHPDFEKGGADARIYRKFAGQYTTWYTRTERREGKTIHIWEALITVHPKPEYYPTYAHALVYAEHEPDVLQLVKWAETLEFEVIYEETLDF